MGAVALVALVAYAAYAYGASTATTSFVTPTPVVASSEVDVVQEVKNARNLVEWVLLGGLFFYVKHQYKLMHEKSVKRINKMGTRIDW